jgi:hypothetical protein
MWFRFPQPPGSHGGRIRFRQGPDFHHIFADEGFDGLRRSQGIQVAAHVNDLFKGAAQFFCQFSFVSAMTCNHGYFPF